MNEPNYCFFFSYSHADWDDDPYLRKFYKDLDRRVARAKALGEQSAGFRDQMGIMTGADWNTNISGAVQASGVLVCIFTPNFFSTEKPFCAREFMAFLKRNPPIRYARMRESDGYRHEVRDARNILPILWAGEKELGAKLPPSMVRKISYSLAATGISEAQMRAYRQKGLSLIAVQPRSVAYQAILTDLAVRIAALSDNPPERIAPPPDIETLADAFREIPAANVEVVDSDPEPVQTIAGAPERGCSTVLALEASDPRADWVPYAGSWRLGALVEEVAQSQRPRFAYLHQRFDPSASDVRARLWNAMQMATNDQVIPILFIQPEFLADDGIRSTLIELAADDWRGGVAVPAEAPRAALTSQAEAFRDELEEIRRKKNRETMAVRIPATLADFRTATDAIVADVASRIVALGTVRQIPPQNDGPHAVPRVTNTHDVPRRP